MYSFEKKYLVRCFEEKIIKCFFMKLMSNMFICRRNNFKILYLRWDLLWYYIYFWVILFWICEFLVNDVEKWNIVLISFVKL